LTVRNLRRMFGNSQPGDFVFGQELETVKW
jgi:hypothetical protein